MSGINGENVNGENVINNQCGVIIINENNQSIINNGVINNGVIIMASISA
jgi:hypothetical protein